ncbi:MAG: hypothetical protein J3K34DRAFT_381734 [Monoraphidium minutum]|nr:MAG: hypothetical protein J3K34DRAFT_381734 [Monoraphidium minutum]
MLRPYIPQAPSGRRPLAGPPALAPLHRAPRAAPKAVAQEVDDSAQTADDFYYILGVPPRASTKEIKDAYRALMKDCHPDLSGDEESTEFATLLNEVYSTLVDPERRATYDSLAGFAAAAVNPFRDASLPQDSVFVDEFSCIGCRNCTHVCPSSFFIEDDWGRARVGRQGADGRDKLQEAIDTCPVSCIHWVTAPQLSLLEAAMERMERVAVWALMSNSGGGAKDVFNEASIAWEKRQAAVRARMEAESSRASWAKWSWAKGFEGFNDAGGAAGGAGRYSNSNSGGDYSGYASAGSGTDDGGSGTDDEAFGGGGGGRERQRIARLAARAARAARQYKQWQEMNASRNRALLGATTSASGDSMDG